MPATPAPPGPGPLTPAGRAALTEVKRTHFSQLLAAEATRIAAGSAAPLVAFTVESTPPSIFVNWVVPDDRAEAFAAAAELPPGFTLAKVRILESDTAPRYWLSLNVYRVSGITTGVRAEWSTYVDDGGGEPRFMILRARAAEGSLDPLGPLALPEPFSHAVDAGGTIRTAMNATVQTFGLPVLTADNLFRSAITLPAPDDRQQVVPTTEWVAANDFIYWLNGVNDRVYYNSTAHRAPLISVDLDDVTLDDDSEWVPYLEEEPAHVLVYLDEIQFVISPWWNVTEVDGRVAPATLAGLAPLKSTIYGGMTNQMALGVLAGTEEPTFRSTIEATPPPVHWHWRVGDDDLAEFRTAIGLPPGLELAPVRLQDDDAAPEHWLNLHVHRRTGLGAGLRAEWTTTVHDGHDVRTLVLESGSSEHSLDPVDLFTQPHPLTHDVVDGAVHTTVGSGATAFSGSFVLPSQAVADAATASRDWIGAEDLRYWRNGVADRVLYDIGAFGARTAIDPTTASVGYAGRWSAFAGTGPDRIWVGRGPVDTAVTPWWNLARR